MAAFNQWLAIHQLFYQRRYLENDLKAPQSIGWLMTG